MLWEPVFRQGLGLVAAERRAETRQAQEIGDTTADTGMGETAAAVA